MARNMKQGEDPFQGNILHGPTEDPLYGIFLYGGSSVGSSLIIISIHETGDPMIEKKR